MTKKYKNIFIILSIISAALVFGPIIAYSIIGLISAGAAEQCILISCVGVATILSIICAINKYTPRSRLFIFLFGLYAVIEHFIPCLLVLGACTMIDEFIICPLKKIYRNKYEINKEIDKRL